MLVDIIIFVGSVCFISLMGIGMFNDYLPWKWICKAGWHLDPHDDSTCPRCMKKVSLNQEGDWVEKV